MLQHFHFAIWVQDTYVFGHNNTDENNCNTEDETNCNSQNETNHNNEINHTGNMILILKMKMKNKERQ